MKQKVVFFYADTFYGSTGYSKVVRELSLRLARNPEYQVIVQELVTCSTPRQVGNVTILGAFGQRGSQPFITGIANHMALFRPDFFIPICDPFLLTKDGIDKINMGNCKMIPYVMMDGIGVPDTSEQVLNKSEKIITAAIHSLEQYKAEGYETYLMHHGVDFNMFKPADKRQQELLKIKRGYSPRDKIFLMVGRNSLRKNPQALIEAIAIFNKNNPDNTAKFYIHTTEQTKEGWDLHLAVKRMERDHNVSMSNLKFSEDHQLGQGITDGDIVNLYQMSDFLVSSANGEGFGLPIIEAIACKKVVIHPNNSVAPELIGDRGLLCETEGTLYAGYGVKQPIVKVSSLAEKIEEAYKMKSSDYKDLAEKGYQWVKENCDWDKITKEFIDIIEDN
jgi:glycosyltransferase involved in cell wall biosynthesis